MNGEQRQHKRLIHFSPLRYPGGKAKLAPFIKAVIARNELADGVYAEPFAGGAGIAIELLLQGYVERIEINDLNRQVFLFWKALSEHGTQFADHVEAATLSVEEWKRQKSIFSNPASSEFETGFATFYLNRTNRSGVLNGGPIGGVDQSGNYLIDARFNRTELAYRIRRISAESSRIGVHNLDAIKFLTEVQSIRSAKSLTYADPPYFRKGRQLYYDYFRAEDHARIAEYLKENQSTIRWLVSYDDVPEIRILYGGCQSTQYLIPYSVRSPSYGTECMFSSRSVELPDFGPADRFSLAS